MHNLFQSRLFLNGSLNEAQIKQDKYMKQAYINDHIILLFYSKQGPFIFGNVASKALINLKIRSSLPALASRKSPYG
jgi:hypothetical protein